MTKLLRPIEILLVEDSPTDRLMAIEAIREAKLLNNLNFVENGVDAIAYLRREGKFAGAAWPDLILLDLNLPRKDGREVLAEIKTDPVLRFIPVVVLTTSGAEDDVIGSYGNHASSFIRKPMDFTQFADSVRRIRDYWFQVVTLPTEEAIRRSVRTRPAPLTTQPKQGSHVRVLLLEDSPSDATLVRQYLQTSRHAAFELTRVSRIAELATLGDLGSYDIALTDLNLPDSQGAETFRAVRRMLPDRPIIVLTGLDDEEQGLQLTREGAHDYLVKQELSPSLLIRTIRHVVDKQRVELQLRQAQRLEAVGQLAAGVAHDFNNLLTVIRGQTGLLELMPSLPSDAQAALTDISEATGRAATLTRQLLTFSRRGVMAIRPVQVNEIVGATSQLLRRLLGEQIAVELGLTAAPTLVDADPGMLEQVVMNLAVNARDAMPDGGRLTITTSTIVVGTDEVTAGAYPGHFVQLAVIDTGAGIDPDVLPHIFQPFYTTKGVAHGTGLGLATVHGIVAQHRGWIRVTTELGKGTRFEIHVPSSTAASAAAPAPQPKPELVGGHERILLVEDDEVVRRSVLRLLARAGYEVVTAASGSEALAIWESEEGRFDLVFTDLVMPGMDGLQLAAELVARRADVKVLFASGYSPDFAAQPHLLVEGVSFLHKPYLPSELMRILRARLA